MADRGLTIERLVRRPRVSRATYRFEESVESRVDSDMEVRDAIQRIALENGPATGGDGSRRNYVAAVGS